MVGRSGVATHLRQTGDSPDPPFQANRAPAKPTATAGAGRASP